MRQTALYDTHRALDAKMVDFAGWSLPLQYEGIVAEHQATRKNAGLFDVSHMGKISVAGQGSDEALQRLQSRDLSRLRVGKAAYAFICNEQGGVIDDILIYRRGIQEFLLVVNAINTEKVMAGLSEAKTAKSSGWSAEDITSQCAQLALQGPAAQAILQSLGFSNLTDLRPFSFKEDQTDFKSSVLISRTGYTGEDGFELYLSPENATKFWQKLIENGASYGLKPVGLGARDSLRLEAALPLYGHELSESITPLEAGLSYFVDLKKACFVGKKALLQQNERGIARKRIGFELQGRALPREGCAVWQQERLVGKVTSGGYGPTLQKGIGMALVDRLTESVPPAQIEIEIRGRRHPAKITSLPFHRKGKAREK